MEQLERSVRPVYKEILLALSQATATLCKAIGDNDAESVAAALQAGASFKALKIQQLLRRAWLHAKEQDDEVFIERSTEIYSKFRLRPPQNMARYALERHSPIEIITILTEHGATVDDFHSSDDENPSINHHIKFMGCFFNAAIEGNVERIHQAIVQGAAVNARTRGEALRAGYDELTLRLPLIPFASSEKNLHATALHIASSLGHEAVVRELLWRPGIEVNARDAFGRTPLYCAVEQDKLPVVEALLTHENIDPNRVAIGGLSPIMLAIGNDPIMSLLLAHPHIAPCQKDFSGEQVLHRTVSFASNWGAAMGTLDLLLEDPRVLASLHDEVSGKTLLDLAQGQPNCQEVILALHHAADKIASTLTTGDGRSSLHLLAETRYLNTPPAYLSRSVRTNPSFLPESAISCVFFPSTSNAQRYSGSAHQLVHGA